MNRRPAVGRKATELIERFGVASTKIALALGVVITLATGCSDGGGNERVQSSSAVTEQVQDEATAGEATSIPDAEPSAGVSTPTATPEQEVVENALIFNVPGGDPVDLTSYFEEWTKIYESNDGLCDIDNPASDADNFELLASEWADAWVGAGYAYEVQEGYQFGVCQQGKVLPAIMAQNSGQTRFKLEQTPEMLKTANLNRNADFETVTSQTVFTDPLPLEHPVFPGASMLDTLREGDAYCLVSFVGMPTKGENASLENGDSGTDGYIRFDEVVLAKIGYRSSIDENDMASDGSNLRSAPVYRDVAVWFDATEPPGEEVYGGISSYVSINPYILDKRYVGIDPDEPSADYAEIWTGNKVVYPGDCQ